ncbi:SurA N-terminal domain-containing protein [Stella sp.]|uniref:SurA N-terminal domain-containing protein n=1 Tax=Stella sp. TaxID=2912054 RepID=UPI0035B05882
MLQAIRSRATSWVVKILFLLLILSFGVWGIGDIFRQPGAEATVIRVGDAKISGVEVVNQIRRDVEQLRPMFGGTLDMAQARELGIVDRSIEQIVQQRLYAQAANDLGIVVGDDAVRRTLAANPQFRSAGQFDARAFQSALQQMRTTEQLYVGGLRQDIARVALADPVVAGAGVGRAAAELLYRHRNEKRRADAVLLPRSLFADVGTPDDAQLAQTLERLKDRFSTPELRRVTAIVLSPDALAEGIAISDADVAAEYAQRKAEFTRPEQRRLQQILVPDEAQAKQVADALAAGQDFATVARDIAKQDPAGLDIGLTERAGLPEELAPVFDTPAGQATAPLRSALGWHVLRVAEVVPEAVRPLAEVKDAIAQTLRRDRALDALSEQATKLEDALAGGARMDEAAAAVGVSALALPPLDAQGRDADGQPVSPLPGGPELPRIAFDTATGETAPIVEMPEGGYLAVHVDEVIAPRVRALSEVRDAVAQAWVEERQTAAADKLADEVLAAVKSGRTLADAVAGRAVEVKPVGPFARTGGREAIPLPQAAVTALFAGPVGTAAKGTVADGVAVGVLTAIEPVDPAQEQAAVDTLRQTLERDVAADLGQELGAALRRRVTVEIDRAAIDRLL